VAEVFATTHQESLPESKLGVWLDRWLEAKGVEASEGTVKRYGDIIQSFRKFAEKHLNRDIASLSSSTIAAWRDTEAKRLSRSSVNLALKTIRSCLSDAMKQGLLTVNPAGQVPVLKNTGASARREFTIAEIKRLREKGDSEWKGMILFGLYTGQRLGDLACLTWRNVDIERNEIALSTQKTGRRIVLPMVKPLHEYIATLDSSDDPDAFLFPTKAAAYKAGSLSGQFYNLLVDAGMAKARTHVKAKDGRKAKREKSQISFHSLRHSAVTFLKAAGVSDALAREIIGHESAAVSRAYTHLNSADVAKALNKLPDIT
jgi:integrase